MKYPIGFLLLLTSGIHADLIQTGGNDYYMTPPQQMSPYTVPASSAVEQCWYEQVPITGSNVTERNPNVAGAIVGGIIGGVVGHQFGSGSGKTVATMAGAALGATLGSTPQPSTPGYQTVRKCNTIR